MTSKPQWLHTMKVSHSAKVCVISYEDLAFCPFLLLWELHPWCFHKHHQFSSVAQSCLILCDPMNCSTPGLPVDNQLPESTQTHVYWVSDAIQPSHPLSSPSAPSQSLPASESFPMSQLSTWGGQSTGASALASVLPVNTQDWSPLQWTTLKSLLQHHSSKASILRRLAFFTVQPSHPYMTTGKTIALTRQLCWQSNVSAFEYAI